MQFSGACFSDFIQEYHHEAFANSANLLGKHFLQDGDTQRNSMTSKRALDDVSARLFSIPPSRRPDINPTESFFVFVQSKLHREMVRTMVGITVTTTENCDTTYIYNMTM